MLQKTHKYTTYPSLRSVQRTDFKLLTEKFHAILWRRHAGVPMMGHKYGGRKSTKAYKDIRFSLWR